MQTPWACGVQGVRVPEVFKHLNMVSQEEEYMMSSLPAPWHRSKRVLDQCSGLQVLA